MVRNTLKSSSVHTARFLKYVWPFFNFMYESVKQNPRTTWIWKTVNPVKLQKLNATPQLAQDVVTTLGFGCILVATSDNVVTTLLQRCVFDVGFPTWY